MLYFMLNRKFIAEQGATGEESFGDGTQTIKG